jgi:Sap, sulfolipid-1-addressing protein
VVFDLVLIGLAIALDPLPLTAFLIVLPSERGVRKGAAFVFGWLASLAVVVTVTVLATGDNPPKPSTAPSLADLAVKIAIGVSLVAIAVRQRRRMERPKKPKKPPKWRAKGCYARAYGDLAIIEFRTQCGARLTGERDLICL